ncbi:multidrug DMT transporter (plasmid) [Escherichia coli]|uniref:DMT family transporter n=1 Tax=Escherichia coli TaxID=562 RepID=UPI0017ACF9E2|nr:SMR family transporter [Escherichia coli]EJE7372399.1 multidrug DMT transporter [Shigella dysenteriae]EEQ4813763.1 multidrug DMT transporter [Escherichia coli]EER2915379.1 multidrug DMT transporter [Escherichia coli]EET2643530.1 multidrug DMT transporter [Escherichia coli]EFB3864517.1 multidrug DMT transporter [Escherichia coli]
MLHIYIVLAISICAETLATVMVKASEGFTRIIPSIIVIIGYAISFYGLSLVVRTMNVGIVYATWAGMGIFLVSVMSFLFYNQKIDLPCIIGMSFITGGVLIIHLYSRTVIN